MNKKTESYNLESIYFLIASLLSILSYNFYIYNIGWFLVEIGAKKLSVSLSWSIFFLPGLLFIFQIKKMLVSGKSPYQILKIAELFKIFIFLFSIILLKLKPSQITVYGISMLLGTTYIVFFPMSYSILKDLSLKLNSQKIVSKIEISYQLAGVVGLLVSGFLYKYTGFIPLIIFSLIGSVVAFILYAKNEKLNLLETFSKIQKETTPEKSNLRTNKLFIEKNKLIFGFIHQIPQMSVLIFNIPLFLYIEELMHGGPQTFGIIDSCFSLLALLTGLGMTKIKRTGVFENQNLILITGLILFGILAILSFFDLNKTFFPYLLIPIIGIFSTVLKITTREIIISTHSQNEISIQSIYYQIAGNIFLVLGAIVIGQIINFTSVRSGLFILGAIFFIFSITSNYLLTNIVANTSMDSKTIG